MPALRLAASQSHRETESTRAQAHSGDSQCLACTVLGGQVLPVSALVGSETHGQDPGEGLDFPYLNPTTPAIRLSSGPGAYGSTSVVQRPCSTYGQAAAWLPSSLRRQPERSGGAAVQPARRACEAQRAEGNRLLRSQPLRGNLPGLDRTGARGAYTNTSKTAPSALLKRGVPSYRHAVSRRRTQSSGPA